MRSDEVIRKKVIIKNNLGLHARAAAKWVDCTSRYQSQVKILKNNQEINGKNILDVMLIAASKGHEIEVLIDGPDEQEAWEAIEALVENKFCEE